jgi:hypothetical protein
MGVNCVKPPISAALSPTAMRPIRRIRTAPFSGFKPTKKCRDSSVRRVLLIQFDSVAAVPARPPVLDAGSTLAIHG